MPSITLKDLPRTLHRDLKARARAHHRSLNQEMIATLLAATAAARPIDLAALEEDSRRARSLFKRKLRAGQITSWKHAGRS